MYWTKMVQNGPDDHFGQNDLFPNWILAFARPKWTKMVHFGPFWPEGPFWSIYQKTREGCGCPKFPAGKVFRQISTLLENDSPIFRQREMLSLPRFGHFPARKTAAGKLAVPAGTLLDFLLRDRHSLLEFF